MVSHFPAVVGKTTVRVNLVSVYSEYDVESLLLLLLKTGSVEKPAIGLSICKVMTLSIAIEAWSFSAYSDNARHSSGTDPGIYNPSGMKHSILPSMPGFCESNYMELPPFPGGISFHNLLNP